MTTQQTVRDLAAAARLELSAQELATVLSLVEETGNLAPEAEVTVAFKEGKLSPGALTFFLPRMWSGRADDSAVPTETWRAMFEHAEYTEDTVVRRRPSWPRLAYRGATPENREGLSWSLDMNQARYFARYRQAPGVTTARVWAAIIPANRVFARFLDGMEKELTADVRGLDIRPADEIRHLLKFLRLGRYPRTIP